VGSGTGIRQPVAAVRIRQVDDGGRGRWSPSIAWKRVLSSPPPLGHKWVYFFKGTSRASGHPLGPPETGRRTLAVMTSAADDLLAPLNALVGSWAIRATHPAFPTTVVGGQSEFAWLEGERFLLQRSRTDHPDFPDSLIVLGEFEDGLGMQLLRLARCPPRLRGVPQRRRVADVAERARILATVHRHVQ
jgi:hypothetical protein